MGLVNTLKLNAKLIIICGDILSLTQWDCIGSLSTVVVSRQNQQELFYYSCSFEHKSTIKEISKSAIYNNC